MNIRIRKLLINILLFFSLPCLLPAVDLPGLDEAFRINIYDSRIFYDSNPDTHELEILTLSEDSWLPLPSSGVIPADSGESAWVKISLPRGSLGQELYLTEHYGMGSWDVFFFSENFLLDKETIDWNSYNEGGRSSPEAVPGIYKL